MIQNILVTLIVVAAFAVAVWKLMPGARRLRLLTACDTWAARRPALTGLRRRWIAPRLARAGGGCAGCAANVGVRKLPPSQK